MLNGKQLQAAYKIIHPVYVALTGFERKYTRASLRTVDVKGLLQYCRDAHELLNVLVTSDDELPRELRGIDSSADNLLESLGDILEAKDTAVMFESKLRSVALDSVSIMEDLTAQAASICSRIERAFNNTRGETMNLATASLKLTRAGVKHVIVEAKQTKKWIQEVTKSMEKKGTEGSLHRYLKIPEGETIPVSKLREALKNPKTSEKTRKRIQFALNMRKLNK